MKKLFLLLAVVGMMFTACTPGSGVDEDSNVNNNGNQTEQPGGGNDDVIPTDKIVIKPSTITVEAAANNYIVAVSSSCSWCATTEADWITLETELGIDGEQQLSFAAKDYYEAIERQGKIVVSNSDKSISAELTVVQKAFVPEWSVEPETLAFGVEGGAQEVAIVANFEYEVKSAANWLTIEKNKNGIKVTATASDVANERTAKITISSEEYGVSKAVWVKQGAFVPELSIEPEALSFESAGGKQEIAITANFEYTYIANADWISLEKVSNGISVTASVNSRVEDRKAVITISNEKYGLFKKINISQSGDTNTIIYTSSDGKIVTPYNTNAFGANIISNVWDSTAGEGVITFDGEVASIGSQAFYECSNLTNITIPDSVTEIGTEAFRVCSRLKSVTIGNSVTKIEKSAFSNCSSLTSITIPDSVTEIGRYAFDKCDNITSITIPDNVTSIGECAFRHCESLAAFYGKFASSDNRCLIINGVLNSYAPAVDFDEYTIPNSVTSIENYAFDNCKRLNYITIPDSVTSIGKCAFCRCGNLVRVYCKSVTPPSGGDAMFDLNGVGRKIYVPRESVEAYKAAEYWSDYDSKIEGYDFE